MPKKKDQKIPSVYDEYGEELNDILNTLTKNPPGEKRDLSIIKRDTSIIMRDSKNPSAKNTLKTAPKKKKLRNAPVSLSIIKRDISLIMRDRKMINTKDLKPVKSLLQALIIYSPKNLLHALGGLKPYYGTSMLMLELLNRTTTAQVTFSIKKLSEEWEIPQGSLWRWLKYLADKEYLTISRKKKQGKFSGTTVDFSPFLAKIQASNVTDMLPSMYVGMLDIYNIYNKQTYKHVSLIMRDSSIIMRDSKKKFLLKSIIFVLFQFGILRKNKQGYTNLSPELIKKVLHNFSSPEPMLFLAKQAYEKARKNISNYFLKLLDRYDFNLLTEEQKHTGESLLKTAQALLNGEYKGEPPEKIAGYAHTFHISEIEEAYYSQFELNAETLMNEYIERISPVLDKLVSKFLG